MRQVTLLVLVLYCAITSAKAQTIFVGFPKNGAVYQRDSQNKGVIKVLGTYNSTRFQRTFTRLEATLIKLDVRTGNPIPAEPEIKQTLDKSGTFFSGRFMVNSGWYELKVQSISIFNNLPLGSPVVSKVGVGEVFLIAGQSNAQGIDNDVAANAYPTNLPYPSMDGVRVQPNARLTEAQYAEYSANPNRFDLLALLGLRPDLTNLSSVANNQARIGPMGRSLWYWAAVGEKIANQYNVPVAFFNAAWFGTFINTYARSTNPNYSPLGRPSDGDPRYNPGTPYGAIRNSLRYFGSTYGLRAILWHQGETDTEALNSTDSRWRTEVNGEQRSITSSVDYTNKLNQVIAASRTDFGSQIPWVVAQTSFFVNNTSSLVTNGQLGVVNRSDQIYQGPNTDIAVTQRRTGSGEPVHFTGQGLVDAANAWFASLHDVLTNAPPITVQQLGTEHQTLVMGTNGNTVIAPTGTTYEWVDESNGSTHTNNVMNNQREVAVNNGSGACRAIVTNSQGNLIMTQAINMPYSIVDDTGETPPPDSQCKNGNEKSAGNRTPDNNGVVGGFGNSSEFMEYTFNVATAGSTNFSIHYASGDPQAGIMLVVNGTSVPMYRPSTASWTPNADASTTINLVGGTNTIRIQGSGDGNFSYDRLCIGSGSTPPPTGCAFSIAPTVSNGNPSCGQGITLFANCSGADCGGATFNWSGSNGQTYSGTSPGFAAPTGNGSVTYTLTVSKAGCGNQVGSTAITVTNCGGTPPTGFGIASVQLNCGSGVVTINLNSSNGNPVEYRAPGLQDWSTNQLVIPSWQRNNTAFTFYVRQSGNGELSTGYTSNCGGGRMATQSEPTAEGLWVSPNPTSGRVVARFTLDEGQRATLSVVNLTGQSLQTRAVVGTGKAQDETLDLSQQATGLYVVRLQTAVGAKTAKVILQR